MVKPTFLSERLPAEDECSTDGMCWVFIGGDKFSNPCWSLEKREWLQEIVTIQAKPEYKNYPDYRSITWLPYSALPMPYKPSKEEDLND